MIVTLEFTSVHGIGIVVLIKWMKCVIKIQLLLASTPCYKSHMIILVTVNDFIFQLSMILFTHFEDFATVKMAARAIAVHAPNSKHQSNRHGTKPGAGSQILMWQGLMYGYMTIRPEMYPSTNLPRCVMPFRSKAHAFSLYDHLFAQGKHWPYYIELTSTHISMVW